MPETTFEVRVPTSLLQLGLDQDEIQRRVTEWLVVSLFTEGHISSGKAAWLLHISGEFSEVGAWTSMSF